MRTGGYQAMVVHNAEHSWLERGFAPFVWGGWKIQAIIYGTTFCVALATALVADLVLRQSQTFAALLSTGVALLLLLLTPILSAKLNDNVRRDEAYSRLRTDFDSLMIRVSDLTAQIDESARPFEMILSPEASADLELLIKNTHSSTLEYVQETVFSDPRLQLLSVQEGGSSKLTLSVGFKSLVEHLAMVNGFVSAEKYLEFVVGTRATKGREAMEREEREREERRNKISDPRKVSFFPKSFIDPSQSREKWSVKTDLQLKKAK